MTIEVIPQQQILLWPVLDYQHETYGIERTCPYCHSDYTTTEHNPGALVECLHAVGEDTWWTTDVVCQSCLESYGLVTTILVFQSQCGDIEMVQYSPEADSYRVLN